MIVVGSRGRGPVTSLLLGSVSVAVSKHASCPVVVQRPTPTDTTRHGILVGVDGTESSLPAIEFAYRMASSRELSLTVLHCYWDRSTVSPRSDGRGPAATTATNTRSSPSRLPGWRRSFPRSRSRLVSPAASPTST